MRIVLIGLVLALAASACGGATAGVDPAAQPAVTDLAERLGVDESAITVVSIEEVTWPDGSLGCPEPGMMYSQALEDGTLIVLDVDGTTYEYHSGVGADPFYCETPTPPVGG
jgi:hypothetical protein